MPTADEIFRASELVSTPALALVDPSTEPHIVINADRTVTVPSELKYLAVQNDHAVETVTFDCPRYWDNHDLSTMKIFINYICAETYVGVHECANVEVDAVDNTIIHFTWTLLNNATLTAGPIVFLVCAQAIDSEDNITQRWHSRMCDTCSILPGIECGNSGSDNAVLVPDNFDFEERFEEAYTLLTMATDRLSLYDTDNNGIVDNAEAVNGIKIGIDDGGIYLEGAGLDIV